MKLKSIQVEGVVDIDGDESKSGVKITTTYFVATTQPVEAEDIAAITETFKEIQERLYPSEKPKTRTRKKTGAKRTGRITTAGTTKSRTKSTKLRQRKKIRGDDIPF